MIEKNVVFVFGAGVSKELGFPTGGELKEKILEGTKNGDHEIYKHLNRLNIHDTNIRLIEEFRDALRLSVEGSIDAFLQAQKKFRGIACAAITAIIAKHENYYNFQKAQTYKYLFKFMKTDRFEDFSKNKVSIITFNYDRSFEQFLFQALKYAFPDRSEDEYAAMVGSITIVHVHGKIGYLPWEDAEEQLKREYVPLQPDGAGTQSIENIHSQIKIVHDDHEESQEFREAQVVLNNASEVYFMGLGYDPINLQRLGVSTLRNPVICGTSYHLENEEIRRIKRQFAKETYIARRNLDAYTFLRKHFDPKEKIYSIDTSDWEYSYLKPN